MTCIIRVYVFGVLVIAKIFASEPKDNLSIPQGYIWNEKIGAAYKLVNVAQKWADARDSCSSEGTHLAIPDTLAEFEVLRGIVRGMHYSAIVGSDHKLLVWLGISNVGNYTVWMNVLGQDIQETEFHTWSGGNGIGFSNDPDEPHCAVIDAHNAGLRDWWCHKKLAYICEFEHSHST